MSWSISLVKNEVQITEACAKALFAAQKYEGEVWDELNGVTHEGVLYFNYDHMEHMDWLGTNGHLIRVLLEHKVSGDICFGSLDGDNDGQFWGYRFDGKGGVKMLTGTVVYEESAERPTIAGKTFVITGKLSCLTRNKLAARLRDAGAFVKSGITKDTDFLIVGEKPGSKFDRALLRQDIGILKEDDLKELFGNELDL